MSRKIERAIVAGIDRACARPMQWGRDDCAMWCADILKDALGYDAAESFRRRYRTGNGARRVTGRRGLLGALRSAARRHGWQPIEPQDAQVGDIGIATINVLVDGKRQRRPACMICRAPGWFVGRNEMGFTALPARALRRTWSVSPRHRGAASSLPALRTKPVFVPTSAAQHEPISLSIAGVALAAGASAGAATAIGVIGTAALSIGVSMAVNYAVSSLTQTGTQPLAATGISAKPNDPSVRFNERQALPSKRIIYGSAQVGGALFFEQKKPPYLYQGLLLCARPITAFRKVWIGTTEIAFASLTPGQVLTPLAIDGQPNYPGRLQLSLRLGAADQSIDPILESDFPGLSVATLISAAAGTNIGDMTENGGLAAAFDGSGAQVFSASAVAAGLGEATLGKDYGVGVTKTVARLRLSAPTDRQFSKADDAQVRIELEASNDNFASTDVLLDIPAKRYDKGAVVDKLIENVTAYRYYRVRLTPNEAVATVAEVELFEPGATATTFAQRGIATAVLRYDFGADQAEFTALWGQVQRPNPLFLVDGVAIYDPRDPTQGVDDETTWKFSNNAALVQADYLRQRYGGRIASGRIDWDKVALSADWDDGLIGCADGGMIKRHTIDGVINLNQRPSDVLSSMISANRGFILETAGRVWPSSSRPRASSIATIHDAILAGGISYRAAKPKRDLVNRLKSRFVAEDREYQIVDGPVLSRGDLQTADGEILDATIDLPFTMDHRRAQRLQKAFLGSARLGRAVEVSVDVKLLGKSADKLVGNVVTISSDLFPQANGDYLVREWGFGDNFSTIEMSLEENDATIETDWNAAADEQEFVLAALDVS